MSSRTPSEASIKFYPPLSYRAKLSYGVGHVLNDLCASMWFTYLLVYFHLVLNYSNSLAGVILLIGQIADGISTPFVGFESDKTESLWLCGKYGRRKTWHLIGTICVLCSFPFLFIKCIGCETSHQWAQLIYYSAFVIIFQFGWASVQISHLSLIPDMSADPHERTELNAIRYGFTVISNICVYSITWIVIGVSDDQHDIIDPEDASKFQNIVLIVVGIGAVFSAIFHIGVKEDNDSTINEGSLYFDKLSNSYRSDKIPMMWKDWLKCIQFYQVAVLYMCTRLFVNLSQVYIPLFLQDTLHLHETSVAIIPLVMFISGFLSSFFMKFLNKRVGRKITYLLGALVGVGACIWIYSSTGEGFRNLQLYFVAALLGIGGSTMLITSLSITNDLIGCNVECTAFVFGVMSFFDKIANGLFVMHVQANVVCSLKTLLRKSVLGSCGVLASRIESGAFVFGAMSLTDKFSNGLVVLLVQYFHPCEACCVECAAYYRYVLACGCGGAVVLAMFALATLAPFAIGERKTRLMEFEDEEQDSPVLGSRKNSETKSLLSAEYTNHTVNT